MHNVLRRVLRGVSLAYVAPRYRQMAQNIRQPLRVNPRRNLNIEKFTDANAFRPVSYVAHLWCMISKTTYGVPGRRKSFSFHHLYRDGGI